MTNETTKSESTMANVCFTDMETSFQYQGSPTGTPLKDVVLEPTEGKETMGTHNVNPKIEEEMNAARTANAPNCHTITVFQWISMITPMTPHTMTMMTRMKSSSTATTATATINANGSSIGHPTTTVAIVPVQPHPPAQPTILACSAYTTTTQARLLASKELYGPLCKHRKKVFEHLKPKPLVISTIRVIGIQSAQLVSKLMADQLEYDKKLQNDVEGKKLSQLEANEQSDEFNRVEWEKRWQQFPCKVLNALAKYHAVILTMRFYEHIASKLYDRITLDKLTMDPTAAARKLSKNNGKDVKSLGTQMFHTSLWANGIAFLADYSVHQVLLCFAYYVYVRERRLRAFQAKQEKQTRKRQQQIPQHSDHDEWEEISRKNSDKEEEGGDKGKDGSSDDASITIENVTIVLWSLLKKSSQLFLSRCVGLVSCSMGGAIGSFLDPVYGTLLFSNLGEGMAGVLFDEDTSPASSSKMPSNGSNSNSNNNDVNNSINNID